MPDMYMDVDVNLAEVPVNLLPLLDSTDFVTIEGAVAYNAAGMALRWHFVTTAGAYTVTAVTPTTGGDYDWTDQGDAGIYTIEIPASGGASINNDTEGFGWFTGVATGILPWRGPVIGFRAAGLNDKLIDSAYSATRALAGTALPDAAADAAGGLPISDAGGLDIDAKLANTNEVTAARMGALTDLIDGGRLDLLIDAILLDTGTTLDALIKDVPTVAEFEARTLVSGGYASPTNITAGTITTVTNLTNAPTAGDLTATMKTSVTTAATAATPTAAAVTGAVGSVTGAVGSVTGNVGGNVAGTVASVVGAVGSVTGNVGGNVAGTVASVVGAVGSVTGAVGSVTGNVGGNVTGSVGSVAAGGIAAASFAAGAITAAAVATDAIDADALAADALAEINAQVVDALATDTYAEPAAVPAATSSLKDKICWLFALGRNKVTQTATTQLVRNDADGATIGTSTVSDDGTTFIRGEFS